MAIGSNKKSATNSRVAKKVSIKAKSFKNAKKNHKKNAGPKFNFLPKVNIDENVQIDRVRWYLTKNSVVMMQFQLVDDASQVFDDLIDPDSDMTKITYIEEHIGQEIDLPDCDLVPSSGGPWVKLEDAYVNISRPAKGRGLMYKAIEE
tara:strand:+ start:577 stop:1020 length:444 start_codon:yes stop_codon:yes gene_type:complete